MFSHVLSLINALFSLLYSCTVVTCLFFYFFVMSYVIMSCFVVMCHMCCHVISFVTSSRVMCFHCLDYYIAVMLCVVCHVIALMSCLMCCHVLYVLMSFFILLCLVFSFYVLLMSTCLVWS